MLIETSRRSFITGLVSLVAAPAIVRAGSLMPVKAERWLTFNEVVDRYWVPEGEVYGMSPAMQALPDLQALQGLFKFLNDHPDATAIQVVEMSTIGSWDR